MFSVIEPGSRTLIFTETKRKADELSNDLRRNGVPAMAIHGDKRQQERDHVLHEFKSGRSPVMVATDVASRGLDVKDIKYVINYDCPGDSSDYVHRVGRTGRKTLDGYNEGTSVTFMTSNDAKLARDLISILDEAGQDVPPQLRDYAAMNRGGGGRSRYGRGGGRGGGFRGGGRGGGFRGGRGGGFRGGFR